MHISEGVLSGPVLASGAAIAIAGVAMGLKKTDYDKIVHVAILASAFFVASLIHVPFGPVSVHLILNGIVGLLLGWAAFPAILAALILQSLFFQYGGLTALGVNTSIMAVPALIGHYLFLPFIGRSRKWTFWGGFFCGALAIFLSSFLLAAVLWFTNVNFFETCIALFAAYLPVMVIEGIVTGFCVTFFIQVFPEIIPKEL
ncbi:MAG: cobalt transporter CbiM [Desulfobacteraceae bacterium]|nr:cobalt transporter CbiM [Desulfobacteraceae bacterium]